MLLRVSVLGRKFCFGSIPCIWIPLPLQGGPGFFVHTAISTPTITRSILTLLVTLCTPMHGPLSRLAKTSKVAKTTARTSTHNKYVHTLGVEVPAPSPFFYQPKTHQTSPAPSIFQPQPVATHNLPYNKKTPKSHHFAYFSGSR